MQDHHFFFVFVKKNITKSNTFQYWAWKRPNSKNIYKYRYWVWTKVYIINYVRSTYLHGLILIKRSKF